MSSPPRLVGRIDASSPPRLLVVDDPLFDEHRVATHHPERPERLVAARAALASVEQRGVRLDRIPTRIASDDEIERVHHAAYVEALSDAARRSEYVDSDTYVAPASIAVAKRAAGGSLALIDALLAPPSGGHPALGGVALLRPPGHHATPGRGRGFCLLNNVALAARRAIEHGGLSRVAVVDWDVHHGNGTQDVFWTDPSVLYLSLHEQPLYPGTGGRSEVGEGEGRGYTVNLPLSLGATDATYAAAFDRLVLPALQAYAPELILVSAGFDAHERDPLASMMATDAAFEAMAASLARLADRVAGGRIALFLEGGYDLAALESALTASLRGLVTAEASPARGPAVSAQHAFEIAEACKASGVGR